MELLATMRMSGWMLLYVALNDGFQDPELDQAVAEMAQHVAEVQHESGELDVAHEEDLQLQERFRSMKRPCAVISSETKAEAGDSDDDEDINAARDRELRELRLGGMISSSSGRAPPAVESDREPPEQLEQPGQRTQKAIWRTWLSNLSEADEVLASVSKVSNGPLGGQSPYDMSLLFYNSDVRLVAWSGEPGDLVGRIVSIKTARLSRLCLPVICQFDSPTVGLS